ncbi:hypothetical protein [Salmonella enterica]|uniref:hypothetical protein n=1 Tax=Salmonella enterica TaxID=28901 RepID=UPI000F7833CC|nr:hypothetical protein [Salmonella enterica]
MRAQKLKRLLRAGDGGTAHATGAGRQPGENMAKWQRERLSVRRTDTRWRDSLTQACARLRGAETLFHE